MSYTYSELHNSKIWHDKDCEDSHCKFIQENLSFQEANQELYMAEPLHYNI